MTIGNITAQDIWVVIASAIAIASILAKLTPSVKDDALLGFVKKFFDFIALNNPSKPPSETPPQPSPLNKV